MLVNNLINNKQNNQKFKGRGYYSPQEIRNIQQRISRFLPPEEQVVTMKSVEAFNAFYRASNTLNVSKVENDMYKKFHVVADFDNNKVLAAGSAFAANIFHKLQLPMPPKIGTEYLGMNIMGSCKLKDRSVSFSKDINWNKIPSIDYSLNKMAKNIYENNYEKYL